MQVGGALRFFGKCFRDPNRAETFSGSREHLDLLLRRAGEMPFPRSQLFYFLTGGLSHCGECEVITK